MSQVYVRRLAVGPYAVTRAAFDLCAAAEDHARADLPADAVGVQVSWHAELEPVVEDGTPGWHRWSPGDPVPRDASRLWVTVSAQQGPVGQPPDTEQAPP